MRRLFSDTNFMIKTIQIAAILLAVLAAAALVLAAMLGIKPDPAKEKLLARPSVVAEFKKSAAAPQGQTKTSPLVAQADKLKTRIDPPPPPKPVDGGPDGGPKGSEKALPPPPPPAKFEVIATCVNPANPSKSFALLSQPGKGLFWVKPKDEVNRTVIKEVLSGKIVDADGREYAVTRVSRPSLLKPGSPVPPGYENYGPAATPIGKTAVAAQPAAAPAAEVERSVAVAQKPAAVAQPVASALAPPTAEEVKVTADWLKEMMANPESMGLTKEEVAQLGDLGQILKDMNSVPAEAATAAQESSEP
jgi:hypothetical protein